MTSISPAPTSAASTGSAVRARSSSTAGRCDLLLGERPSAELFAEAARVATAGLDPPADLNGSPEYRKQVAAALVRRGLQAAADNAYERQ